MVILLGLLAAIVVAACCWVGSFLVADRLFPGTRITVRVVGGLCLGYWLLAWGFETLALVGAFRVGVIFPLVAILAILAGWRWRTEIGDRLTRCRREIQEETAGLWLDLRRFRWVTVGLALVGLHIAVRMLRTLAAPAFGWDDFTYHLFRAGRWVQNGGLVLEPAPDAWTYYEFFPWGGDLIWAWALVWRAGDVLVPAGAIALWCFVLLAAYSVVRELDQDRSTALIVATAIAVLPSQVSQMSTAYVDNAVLAMVLVASLFLLVSLRPQSDSEREGDARLGTPAALLVGASCGLGLLVKMSFLPLLVPAGIILAWQSASRRQPREFVAFLLGLAVAVPNLVFNWILRGSPFYPFEIVDFLPFNEQHSWILSKYGEGATVPELTRAAKALVINLFPLDPFLNMGLLGVTLGVLGTWGSVRLARTSRGRWFLLWVVVGAALTITSFFSPRNSSMVVWWTLMMGRFLVPSLAGLMVLSCLVRPALLRFLVVPLLVVEYFYYARRGWPVEQVGATLKVAALVGLMVLVGLLLSRWRRRTPPLWVSLPIMASLVLLAIVGVREHFRYDAYRLFAERQLLDFHGAPPASAWPIWQRLDETGPHRVAATAGFDGLTGHNWFRGALLGAWLQNEVLYLPVTADGHLVSYRDREKLVEVADRSAWLSRIHQQAIDRVVALGPANIEHRWMLDLPEIFDIEITMGHDHFLLARVNPEALARHLAEVD